MSSQLECANWQYGTRNAASQIHTFDNFNAVQPMGSRIVITLPSVCAGRCFCMRRCIRCWFWCCRWCCWCCCWCCCCSVGCCCRPFQNARWKLDIVQVNMRWHHDIYANLKLWCSTSSTTFDARSHFDAMRGHMCAARIVWPCNESKIQWKF